MGNIAAEARNLLDHAGAEEHVLDAGRQEQRFLDRVAERMGCAYEAEHHDRLARDAGLSDDELTRARRIDEVDDRWPEREAAVLHAVDELGAQGTISDATWLRLAADRTDAQLIELCLLVGHYEMLAKTINTLRIAPDGPPTPPVPAIVRRIERLLSRS